MKAAEAHSCMHCTLEHTCSSNIACHIVRKPGVAMLIDVWVVWCSQRAAMKRTFSTFQVSFIKQQVNQLLLLIQVSRLVCDSEKRAYNPL